MNRPLERRTFDVKGHEVDETRLKCQTRGEKDFGAFLNFPQISHFEGSTDFKNLPGPKPVLQEVLFIWYICICRYMYIGIPMYIPRYIYIPRNFQVYVVQMLILFCQNNNHGRNYSALAKVFNIIFKSTYMIFVPFFPKLFWSQ
jgi:hypothetical protein